MTNDFLQTLDTAYKIAFDKSIQYSERRDTVKQLYKKANSIYRKIYKDLSYWERQEARQPINDLKNYFRF